ncbi:MAG: phosphoribosylamine--glycine ligase [candidate division KSB1 bacterium]|nr:phosphoribosylamine--glycine ligase [candidate division KSB1 bacterium]
MESIISGSKPKIMLWGIGSYAASAMRTLAENGAEVCCYLTRNYGDYGPSLYGETFHFKDYPNPCPLVREKQIDLVIPMSINWHEAEWKDEFLAMQVPILSPYGEAMKLERDRDYGRRLCELYGIPVPKAYVAKNRLDAVEYVRANPLPYVIKNPLCAPGSPVHTIVTETVEDTLSWLEHVNYAEGVFLQEYMGRREAGHVAFVSDGKIYPMVTNQEYKRAFDGNMGPVAGAPLGGLVEVDTEDKYGIVRETLEPLLPWFRRTNFHGPVQSTCVKRDGKWHVIEFNVRTGITTGPALCRMLKNPVEVFLAVGHNRPLNIEFHKGREYACTLTLAGWGYPYTKIEGPFLTVQLTGEPTCDIWWNEVVADRKGRMLMSGHRVADVVAVGPSMEAAIAKAYENIRKIYCLSSYYRLDIGKSLWPPGEE